MMLQGCPVGASVVLRRIDTAPDRRRRLFELGFVPGSRLEVVSRGGVGGIVVAVNTDTRVALGADVAARLAVEPLDGATR